MKKIIVLLVLLIFGFSAIGPVMADGGMIPYEFNDKDIYEPSQTSLIVYKDGMEDIYLKVSYEGETNKFVWLIPTPSFPKVTTAPNDIFEVLSVLTGVAPRANTLSNDSFDLGQSEKANVVVHSQEQVGIYEITVLSATGVDGLFDWLFNNKYPVKDEVKEVLSWYIEKEWYFTAVRINSESLLEKLVKSFQEIDSAVNSDNFIEKFSNYYTNAFENNDFNQFQNTLATLKILDPDGANEIEKMNSIEAFSAERERVNMAIEGEWEKLKAEFIDDFEIYYNNFLPEENISRYSNYIEPIKISFNINTIIYPLKISQISTRVPSDENESIKTNEVLLYVLADEQVTAPDFNREYAQTMNKEKLDEINNGTWTDLTSFREIIADEEYFLTKLRRDFAKVEMDEDVYIINGDSYSSLAESEVKTLTSIYAVNQSYQNAKNKVYGNAMADRLKGKIVLKVEDDGKAFYINPSTKKYHYLGRPNDAFDVMREQGLGITNENLEKIALGLSNLSGDDSDGDGLSDLFEDAIGTNKNNSDSDGDGYEDKVELVDGYNPSGSGNLNIDNDFSENQKGKILLQVEGNGEAWYVSPMDGRRYFLGRPSDAFEIMRSLGLGISNDDFDNL